MIVIGNMKKEKKKKFGRRARLISILKNKKYFQKHPSQV